MNIQRNETFETSYYGLITLDKNIPYKYCAKTRNYKFNLKKWKEKEQVNQGGKKKKRKAKSSRSFI